MQAKIMQQHGERVVQLETNVDDVTGEVLGHLIELLMQAGALDVSVLPALMKKGRSGNVVRALARHEEMESLARIIVRETGSLGVRVFPSLHRFVAERETVGGAGDLWPELQCRHKGEPHGWRALEHQSRVRRLHQDR